MKYFQKGEVIRMKKVLMAVLVVAFAASLCYAVESVKPKANEPVGGVIEAIGVFTGKVVNVLSEQKTGKNTVTVSDDRGKFMNFVVDPTVKITDKGVNAITMDKIKVGENVSVKYVKGSEKAKSIKVE